ncbi:lipopolysaccharide heptosyltransferase I [Francisellaceae bacterium]|nr:lipopolysaccharide heptosyltransferase I [Francisellaceae bacterium]
MTKQTENKNGLNVLLVKHTSLGDLIHALPALTDAQKALPNVSFDWSVNKNFAEIATWHPVVDKIITNDHRKWRKELFKSIKSGEIKHFYKSLRSKTYDYVIDGQTNFKSAITAKLARSKSKCGYDKSTCAEPIAHLAYNKKYHIDKSLHAVERLRMLFADALGYKKPESEPDFGIDPANFVQPNLELPKKYLLFIHNASWVTKLWPEAYWIELTKIAAEAGYNILLPSGNNKELERAERIASTSDKATALSLMKLSELAYIISKAQAAVCVDTGLSHLAAALDIPSIILYGATDSGLIGAVGSTQEHLQSKFPCAPCYLKKCKYADEIDKYKVMPPCFEELPPKVIWTKLKVKLS